MKTILIAGAGKGIGLALAKRLSKETHVMAITRSTSEELENAGIQPFYADLSKADALEGFTWPDVLDGLVYCPGSINLKPFNRLTAADIQLDLEQNVMGAVRLIQGAIPSLKRAGHSSVVLFSTVAVKMGMAFHSSVAISKAAVEGLTKSLAAEYAGSNIRFNAIAPSLTETNLSGFLLSNPEKKEAAAKRHPLQRIGNAEEIAAMADFLLSDNAAWVTGQVMAVDGGMGSIK